MLGMLLTGPALAGAVIVYGGEVAADYRAALRDTGLDPWELQARAADELAPTASPTLWARRGSVLAAVALPACDRAARNAELRESVSVAEGHLNYRRLPEARRVLDSVHARLGCLDEPAEASLAGRVAFLSGVVAALSGEEERATRSYAEALAWQPDLRWEDEFDPSTRRAFDAARTAGGSGATLRLGPGLGEGESLWIDGRRPAVAQGSVRLSPGPHLVQVIGASRAWTAPVVAGTDELVLAHPAGLTAADLRRATDPALAPIYAPLLSGIAAPDDLYLRVDGRTWAVRDDRVEALPEKVGAVGPLCSVPRRCVGVSLATGGAVGLVAGAGVYAWSWSLQRAHADDLTTFEAIAPGTEGASELVVAYDDDLTVAQAERARMMWAGGGLAGAGLVSLVSGVVLSRPRAADEVARGPALSVAWTGTAVGVGATW